MTVTRRGLVASSLLLLGTKASRAQATLAYKIGCNTPADHPLSRRLAQVAATVGERSGGRLAITVFPNSQLGGDTDMLSQVRSGALELFSAPSLTLSTLVPLSGLPSVGYAFSGYDEVWAAMDGALGDSVRAAIVRAGLVPMHRVWDNGFRQITSSRQPIDTPADLADMKLRVPVTPVLTSLFKDLGAAPTSINFSEVYSALQTHVIDGQENPLALIDTAKLYEVQKYCSLSRHCWSGYWMVGNRRAMASLPEDVRPMLEEAMDEAAAGERTDLARMDADLQARLAGHGMAFNTPRPEPFQARLREVGFYRQWRQSFGEEAWQVLARYSGGLA